MLAIKGYKKQNGQVGIDLTAHSRMPSMANFMQNSKPL